MMKFALSLLFLFAESLWYRPFHTIYVEHPEESPEEYRKNITEQVEWQIDRMNKAMEFHEFDFRYVLGNIFSKPSEYWNAYSSKCGDARKRYCTPWANEFGRESDNTLEQWLCVMGDGLTGCSAVGGGNTALCKAGPFFNRNKIVIMHEVGHCLGCGDKAGYCQSDFEQFAQVTGKRYLTAMGGGATCDDTLYGGLEKLKLPLYEDATKQYCESGVCLTLAPPEKECTTTIKNKFEEQVGKLKPYCGSELTAMNGANWKYCIVQRKAECIDSTNFGHDGDFSPAGKSDCAEILEQDESLCPSKTFFWNWNRRVCKCCSLSHSDENFETTDNKWDILQLDITSNTNGDETFNTLAQSYSIPLSRSSNVYAILAIIGFFTTAKYVIDLWRRAKKYSHIPSQIAEI